MKIRLLWFSLLLLLVVPAIASAGTVTGVVEKIYPPYLLLKTGSGHEVVRLLDGGALGNVESLGHLRIGRDRVEVEWTVESNRVKVANQLTRLPVFTVYPAFEVPAEQAATWHDLDSGSEKRFMIDVRSRGEWEEGHILRSLSVPFDFVTSVYSPYPADRAQKIILHGGSDQSSSVQRAAQLATAAGYDNIRVYSGGIEDWTSRGKPLGITAAGAQRRIVRQEDLLIVDVRDREAWNSGHIPGSLSLPMVSFSPEALSVRNRNHPFPVLLVAASEQEAMELFGLRSWGRGYKAPVYFLEGGYSAWKQAGYPVVSGGTPPTAADLLPPGEIGDPEFRSLWERGSAVSAALLLNVRDSDEPTPAGQTNIPFPELERRMKELPADRELVIYCYAGTRAAIAYHMLRNNGYRARFYNRTVRIGGSGELLE